MENGVLQESRSPPEGSSVEGANSSAAGENKARKKNKAGVFARLLDGLSGKGKKPEEKAGKPETAGQKNGELSVYTPEFAVLKKQDPAGEEGNSQKAEKITHEPPHAIQKAQNSVAGGVFFNEEAAPDGNFSLLEQELPAEQDFLRSIRKENGLSGGKEAAGGGNDPGAELNLTENGFPGDAAGKSGAETLAVSFEQQEKTLAGTSRRDKNKAGESGRRLNPDSVRNQEAVFSQSGDALRPELAARTDSARENSRLSELRGKKGRDRLNIEVRAPGSGDEAASANRTNSEASGGTAFNAFQQANTEIELAVDLRLDGRGEGASGKAGSETQSRRFEYALAGELRGNLSTDIVRDASIIVRSGGAGTIRLSLHPESLGNVKIRLEMAENKITGHIIVESTEALRAFERELPVLEKAFRDSGFSETALDMSLAQDGGSYGAGDQRQEGDFPAFMPVLAASRYETAPDWTEDFIPSGTVLSADPERRPLNLLI